MSKKPFKLVFCPSPYTILGRNDPSLPAGHAVVHSPPKLVVLVPSPCFLERWPLALLTLIPFPLMDSVMSTYYQYRWRVEWKNLKSFSVVFQRENETLIVFFKFHHIIQILSGLHDIWSGEEGGGKTPICLGWGTWMDFQVNCPQLKTHLQQVRM